MTLLWILGILGILAALMVLLCLTRVGVHAVLRNSEALVRVRVGPVRFQVYPPKEKKPKEERSEKEKKPPREKPGAEKPKPKIGLPDIKDALQTLWPPLKRALDRTRRGIRVAPLELSVILGGQEDPAAAAERYGHLYAAVWTVMPALEQVLDIRAPHIHVGIDFDAPGTEVAGETGVSIRVGTLLGVALRVGIPALKWFLAFRKKQKKQPSAPAEKGVEQAEETAA